MKSSPMIRYLKPRLKSFVRTGLGWGLFFYDYLICLVNDRHTASPSSSARLRRLYSISKGESAKVLAIPFQLLHPANHNKLNPSTARTVSTIAELGYCMLDESPDVTDLALLLHRRLSFCPVREVSQNIEPGRMYENLEAALGSKHQNAPRLEHNRYDVCLMPETWELIRKLHLREIASAYLRCDPVLTSVDSWYVLPVCEGCGSDALYSAAAQTYHYDMDWIRFLKIFINLTDAPMESGPFEYIPFSHNNKHILYFEDGRFDTLCDSISQIAYAKGPAGSCFFADTSGIHRDGRATAAIRHVLQIEFAVSSFGSKSQYDEIYQYCSERVAPVKMTFPQSSRMFSLF